MKRNVNGPGPSGPSGPSGPEAKNPSTASEVSSPAGRRYGPLVLVPVAALLIALFAWVATALMASESASRGIAGVTMAMFPTGFGAGGLVVRKRQMLALKRSGRRPGAVVLLLVSLFSGIFAVTLSALIMHGIWPDL